jgi:hypothetical protein
MPAVANFQKVSDGALFAQTRGKEFLVLYPKCGKFELLVANFIQLI